MTRRLGDRTVGALGLGCMGMTWAYPSGDDQPDEALAVLHEALELGVTHLDTSDVYGPHTNEELVGRALAGDRRERAVLATKAGLVPGEPGRVGRDGSPAHLHASIDASLTRLGVEQVDLWYLHRVDPAVPIAESWGAMAEAVAAGKVAMLGLSEVSVAQLHEAQAVHPVSAVQSEMSLWSRDPLRAAGVADPGADAPVLTGATTSGSPEPGSVVAWCADHGATFVPFSPLGRGFLTGTVGELAGNDFRSRLARFAPAAREANQALLDGIAAVADRHGATGGQVALAWCLAQGGHVVPIPGTKRLARLRENAAAAELHLGADDLGVLDALPQPVEGRY